MNQCDVVEKPLLERIQSELEADPELYDVTFSVGPQKTKVKALKIILMAASPVFKNEFKTKWGHAVLKDEDGIPLPDFDGESFRLFVKVTSLDAWSVESLEKLKLQLNHLLDLLSICRRYEMRTAVTNLKKLTAAHLQFFEKFKGSADFLKLSQSNLKEVLASDDLPVEETEVFKCALKWAEWKCKEKKLEVSVDNLRLVLGDCLFEIRFPIMSVTDFTDAMELKELLSPEETLKIYKYVGLDASKRKHLDVRSLTFKTKARNVVVPAKTRSNWGEFQPLLRQQLRAQTEAQARRDVDSLLKKEEVIERREEMARREETERNRQIEEIRRIEMAIRQETERNRQIEEIRRIEMAIRQETERNRQIEEIRRIEMARNNERTRIRQLKKEVKSQQEEVQLAKLFEKLTKTKAGKKQ